MPVILVTGATGKIGQHLVHELVARGATPRVYARNEEKARAAFASLSGGGSIEYAVGTNEDLGALAQAARGAERLFLVSNDPHGEPAMVRAALDAGVRHVVKISAVMAGSSHESGTFVWAHGIAERAIQDMKAPVTVLRPHDFMENFLGSAGTIKAQGAFYGNQGDSCIASIAAKDIAAAAAGVLTAPIEEYAGLTFTLTGPDALSRSELAELTSQVIGKPVKFVNVSDGAALATFKGFGLPTRVAFSIVSLGVLYRLSLSGVRFATGWVEVLAGRPATSWKAFLEDNKKAFL